MKTKQRSKRVRMWGVFNDRHHLEWIHAAAPSFSTKRLFVTKASADMWCPKGGGYYIAPVTISYSIPKPRKAKRK
jgi:hypothetical protein